ncbi:MAG: type II secretion system protein [Planctomycetota bacterium]
MASSVSNDRAFTLIEMIVVLVILAIISTGVFLSIAGSSDRYKLQLAADMVVQLDSKARNIAASTERPVQIVYRPRSETIEIKIVDGNTGAEQIVESRKIPANVDVSRLFLRGAARSFRDRQLIEISPLGQSIDYALELKTKSLDRVLAMMGGSGQQIRLDNRKHLIDLWSALDG